MSDKRIYHSVAINKDACDYHYTYRQWKVLFPGRTMYFWATTCEGLRDWINRTFTDETYMMLPTHNIKAGKI